MLCRPLSCNAPTAVQCAGQMKALVAIFAIHPGGDIVSVLLGRQPFHAPRIGVGDEDATHTSHGKGLGRRNVMAILSGAARRDRESQRNLLASDRMSVSVVSMPMFADKPNQNYKTSYCTCSPLPGLPASGTSSGLASGSAVLLQLAAPAPALAAASACGSGSGSGSGCAASLRLRLWLRLRLRPCCVSSLLPPPDSSAQPSTPTSASAPSWMGGNGSGSSPDALPAVAASCCSSFCCNLTFLCPAPRIHSRSSVVSASPAMV